MTAEIPQKIIQHVTKHTGFGWLKGIVAGCGLAYAYENNKSLYHYPLAIVAPGTYGGYHLYRNKGYILDRISNQSRITMFVSPFLTETQGDVSSELNKFTKTEKPPSPDQ